MGVLEKMSDSNKTLRALAFQRNSRNLLLLLSGEKIFQHIVVTVAFAFDLWEIRSTVAVDYRILMYLGLLIGALYFVSFISIKNNSVNGRTLLASMALADVLGEFYAQGRLYIVITVSFIVAVTILVVIAYARTKRVGHG
jgi:hypothetical protein